MKYFFVVLVLIAFNLSARAQDFSQDTAEAKHVVDTTEPRAAYNYCINQKLTCRTLVLLKSKSTGQNVDDFYDVFLSSERAVGSTGYFLKNQNGTFRAILDDLFDGQITITKKFAENQNLTVTFDNLGFPTVHGVNLIRVGQTKYILADLIYTETEAKIVGTEYDRADSTYQTPVSIVYGRVL